MKIGEKIKELRKKRGVTQEQLAENLGVSFQAVSKWENNIAYPDIALVPALASFFEVTTDYLFDYTVPKSRPEVKVFKPETYDDLNKILELLQKSVTVIINFDETDEEIKEQIINQLAADTEVIDGQVNQLSHNSYIVTPKNTRIAAKS